VIVARDDQLVATVESEQVPGWMQDCYPFLPVLQNQVHTDTQHSGSIHIVLLGGGGGGGKKRDISTHSYI